MPSLSQLPELAWMGELKNRDDIDWQAIEEAHEQWQEHEEGVGGPGVTILAIAIAAVMPGILGALGSFGTAIAESSISNAVIISSCD